MQKRVQDDKGFQMIRRFLNRKKREVKETLNGNNTEEKKGKLLKILISKLI